MSIHFKDIQLAIKPMVINFFLDTTTLTQAQIKLETSFLCSFLFAGNLIPKISTNASLKFIESSCKPALDLTALFFKTIKQTI
ncbi:Mga helix-turn-helix domain protein (fragment) [Carnobacterium maltaromaticum]